MAFRLARYIFLCIALVGLLSLFWANHPQQYLNRQGPVTASPHHGHADSKQQIGKERAALVMLVRNRELKDALLSMKQIEDRFNREYKYPWVFLNDEEFTEEFKEWTTKRASGKAEYGLIPTEQWSIPDHIDQDVMHKKIQELVSHDVIYGGSVPYRHMCRYNSGFFYRHDLLKDKDYYWRVEPGIGYFCDQDYDPFTFMRENKKKYGFVMSLYEYEETIKTLWPATVEFIKQNPQFLAPNSSLSYITDDGKGLDGKYNLCHFWSNFEIGDLRFWRSEAYSKYFDFLDKKGGFFYERWGDAPVHSLGAALFLNHDEIHWFNDMSYFHAPWGRCPKDDIAKEKARCTCPETKEMDFDTDSYSCTPRWWKLKGLDEKTGNPKNLRRSEL